jgi:hypothetical protein
MYEKSSLKYRIEKKSKYLDLLGNKESLQGMIKELRMLTTKN